MSMTPFVLHHYDASPYAEKIRLMFGVADAEWWSLLSPPQPPRPNVDPLTGGYRRIPVAQVGADIFCDTALIAEEVANRWALPRMFPPGRDDAPATPAAKLAAQAEGDIFFAAIGSVPPGKLLSTLMGRFGLLGTLRFIKDRAGMMRQATVKPLRGRAAADAVTRFKQDLDQHLADTPFIVGDAPSYADFAIYHPLWLQIRVGGMTMSDSLPNLRRWFSAVEKIGHGRRIETDQAAVFTMARESAPRPLPEQVEAYPLVGQHVSVAPADYGREAVAGTLCWAGSGRLIVARETDAFGTLHVHFPEHGYVVNPR